MSSTIKIGIITMSDRASVGEYKDKSGPLAADLFDNFFSEKGEKPSIERIILPDSEEKLRKQLLAFSKEKHIICVSGGTGIGPRDITPDVIKPMLSKEITGIMEMIRVKYGMKFPNALLSRAIAGVIDSTLIYAIPGSPKAVKEYLKEILPTVLHSLKMLSGGAH